MARFILVTLLAAALAGGTAHAQSTDAALASRLEARAAAVPAKVLDDAERRLERITKRIDDNAGHAGDAKVSARLAAEFGTTAKAMLDAHAGASWGSVVVAHTLAASTEAVTAGALLDLNRRGMRWTEMAAGLGFSASQFASAVAAEANVATGLARPDGRVQGIATGVTAGAQAGAAVQGVAGAATNLSVQSAVSAAGTTVNATTGVGLGIGR